MTLLYSSLLSFLSSLKLKRMVWCSLNSQESLVPGHESLSVLESLNAVDTKICGPDSCSSRGDIRGSLSGLQTWHWWAGEGSWQIHGAAPHAEYDNNITEKTSAIESINSDTQIKIPIIPERVGWSSINSLTAWLLPWLVARLPGLPGLPGPGPPQPDPGTEVVAVAAGGRARHLPLTPQPGELSRLNWEWGLPCQQLALLSSPLQAQSSLRVRV